MSTKEMKEEIPAKELVMNDYPPIEAAPKEEGELNAPVKEEDKLDEQIKEEGEIEDSPMETETIKEEAKEAKETEPSPKEEGEIEESTKDNMDGGDDSSKKESDEPEDHSTVKHEMETESSEENAMAVRLNELVANWKNALESESADDLEKIYDGILELSEEFSLEFLVENKLDVLMKQSQEIGKSKKFREARNALKELHKKRKAEDKEAKREEARAMAAEEKKRKREEAKAAKSEKKRKIAGELGINTRLKPEKVVETSVKVLKELVKNHAIGLTEMPLETLATRVGYKNPRSDAVADAIKLLKHRGTVEKISEKIKLTQKGIDENVEEEAMQAPDNPEALVEMYWEQFESRMKATKKGSGDKALAAAKRVWDLLKDGQAHGVKEVLKTADYAGENSGGFEEIKRQLKLLDFAVKENKKFTFTAKVLKPLRGEM